MRCPKCGYISFDHLESCKKCNKNISEASADIDGTVFAVAAPVFLDFEHETSAAPLDEKEEDLAGGEKAPGQVEERVDLSFEDVEIEGDTETGQHIRDIMNDLDLDWEEQIATLVGDVVGHKIGNVVRGAADWATQTRSTVEQDVSEYLQEESRLLPHREEIGPFLEAVDTLRSDVDRMEARVQRLLTPRGAVE